MISANLSAFSALLSQFPINGILKRFVFEISVTISTENSNLVEFGLKYKELDTKI